MSDWFDPQNWMRRIPDPLNVRGFIQGSAAATLNELAAVAKGRRVELRRGTGRVLATIRSVDLQPSVTPPSLLNPDASHDALDRAVIELEDVTWHGYRFDRVHLDIEAVRITHIPSSRMSGGPVTVQAEIPVDTLQAWMADSGMELDPRGSNDEHLTVRYQWWRMLFAAKVVPTVTARSVVFTIRELAVRGRAIPLPTRFHLSLSVNLDLEPGVRLRDAQLLGPDAVAVEAQVRAFQYPIHLDRVIDRMNTTNRGSVVDIEVD